MFLLDLNSFKRINDLYGHGIGDEVLVNIAMRLRRACREDDLVARFGGDEFAILASIGRVRKATSIALRMIKELEQPIKTGSIQHNIGAGVGIALLPQDGRNGAEILRKADIALYRAKEEQPKSTSRFFDAEMDANVRERDLIERELQIAVNKEPCNRTINP